MDPDRGESADANVIPVFRSGEVLAASPTVDPHFRWMPVYGVSYLRNDGAMVLVRQTLAPNFLLTFVPC